jgi:hypothetical protein
MALAAPALGAAIFVSFILLFARVDVAAACPGCQAVNCMVLTPGLLGSVLWYRPGLCQCRFRTAVQRL